MKTACPHCGFLNPYVPQLVGTEVKCLGCQEIFTMRFSSQGIHKWRKPKSSLILMISSVVGFVVFALLHNVFYAIGIKGAAIPGVSGLMEILGGVSFLIAIVLCPAGAVVGAVGSLFHYVRNL